MMIINDKLHNRTDLGSAYDMAVGRQAHSLKLTGDHNQISDEKQYHDQIFVQIVGKKGNTRIRYLMRNY